MLRLTALDADDLNVISAQMQDAVLKFADLNFNSKRRRFALVANRFAWDDAKLKTRRRTGLHFDHVISVQKQGFKNVRPETILSLLAIALVIRISRKLFICQFCHPGGEFFGGFPISMCDLPAIVELEDIEG